MGLKIFSISKNDWAGCGYFLSDAINKCTEHHSRALRLAGSYFEFPFDMMGLRGQQTKRLYDWCDIIHIHDADISLPRLDKPSVITFHGSKFRANAAKQIKICSNLGYLLTVATPDLTTFGLPLLPDCRPDLSEYVDRADEFTVAHAPTKREVKGTERVIEACKKVGVKLDLIEDVLWKECLERKGRAHLVIDQFELGFGCNAIEAWSMGLPVIADAEDDRLKAIQGQFGYLPFVRPEPTLADAIVRLRDDVDAWAAAAAKGYQHYLNVHSYKAASELAVWMYGQAIDYHEKKNEKKAAMLPKQRRAEELVLMRYLGGNTGVTNWFANGTKYQFSGASPERYVYTSDVEWFLDQKSKAGKPLFVVRSA